MRDDINVNTLKENKRINFFDTGYGDDHKEEVVPNPCKSPRHDHPRLGNARSALIAILSKVCLYGRMSIKNALIGP